MLKNKFFYIILFAILVIYAYKFFVFNHYIIEEIVIENQSNRSDTDNIKNKLQSQLVTFREKNNLINPFAYE